MMSSLVSRFEPCLITQALGGWLVVQASFVLYADQDHVFPGLPGRVETGDRWPREGGREEVAGGGCGSPPPLRLC